MRGLFADQAADDLGQHIGTEGLVQERDAIRFQRRELFGRDGVSAAGDDAESGIGGERFGGEFVRTHAGHGGVDQSQRVIGGRSLDVSPSLLGAAGGNDSVSKLGEVARQNFEQLLLIVDHQDAGAAVARLLVPAGCMIALMRFHTEYLTFRTQKQREYINITPHVEQALKKSGIQEGMILVSAMHITAGVWVNDAEDGLIADIDEWLEQLAPFRQDYRHHATGESNGDSHLKSLLVHHQVIVPVTAGKLDFGPWQQVYYAEFDGRRAKRVILKVMGE